MSSDCETFFIGRPEADGGFGIDCAILGAVLLDKLVTVLQDQRFPSMALPMADRQIVLPAPVAATAKVLPWSARALTARSTSLF